MMLSIQVDYPPVYQDYQLHFVGVDQDQRWWTGKRQEGAGRSGLVAGWYRIYWSARPVSEFL